MTKYLSVDFNSGTLYEYSPTEKEGFEQYTSATGKVSFRRYERKGVTGELLSVGIKDTKFGDEIWISQKVENGDIVVSKLKLYDKSFNIEQNFAEPFTRLIGNLKKGETYKFQPYVLSAEDQRKGDEEQGREVKNKYYEKAGVSIKLADGTRVENTLYYKGDDPETTIPETVWKDHPSKQGKRMPSASSLEIKTEFLINKLKEGIANGLAYQSSSSSNSAPAQSQEAPSEAPTTAPTAAEPVVEEEYDDLPF